MKQLWLGLVLCALPSVATAAMSDCRAIQADTDRLACYDALAAAELASGDVPVAANPAVKVGIDGFYAAIGGGILGSSSWDTSSVDTSRSGVVKGVAGFNHMIGDYFMGTEVAARIGTGNNSLTSSGSFTPVPDSFGDYFSTWNQVEFREQASGDLAIRFGRKVGDWTFFGRAGGGVASLRVRERGESTACTGSAQSLDIHDDDAFAEFYTWRLREFGEVSIDDLLGRPDLVSIVQIPCTASASYMDASRTIVRPTAMVGIGVERDFGRFFGRVDGELRHIFYDRGNDGNGITQIEGTALIGVRF